MDIYEKANTFIHYTKKGFQQQKSSSILTMDVLDPAVKYSDGSLPNIFLKVREKYELLSNPQASAAAHTLAPLSIRVFASVQRIKLMVCTMVLPVNALNSLHK